ncbi:CRISPR-associated endonuclease Cas6 [Cryomorpha ignava]|uniref:CRISPR-associated endonuclease Cas6 n=1 Tax=Cryomorpha ignava TaxID=101383 RepID=A0A7K3WMA6_9FLAO|nr:CRISPR-associated endonuclease Cas6 [Cryomorpha ignava]NEN22783.1 CRISPR-associated endonuclease Cas6 [Cryomorpha ignava]
MPSTTTQNLSVTQIKFPEIQLHTRDAHKLRGYFGNVFKDNSPLLHNHYDSGQLRYRYPLVQYKILNNTPTLVAIDEGAELLTQLFLKIQEIDIDGKKYPIQNKHITSKNYPIGIGESLFTYTFETLWMALNQENYKKYTEAEDSEKRKILNRILVGNILSFFKSTGLMLEPDERILATTEVEPKKTKFKDQSMVAFTGRFTTNAQLPDFIGIGKSVSRGFGTILQV